MQDLYETSLAILVSPLPLIFNNLCLAGTKMYLYIFSFQTEFPSFGTPYLFKVKRVHMSLKDQNLSIFHPVYSKAIFRTGTLTG